MFRMERKLTRAEVKYGYLWFGARNRPCFPGPGESITILDDAGRRYTATMHRMQPRTNNYGLRTLYEGYVSKEGDTAAIAVSRNGTVRVTFPGSSASKGKASPRPGRQDSSDQEVRTRRRQGRGNSPLFVDETDVLIAVALWLHNERKCRIRSVSLPSGQREGLQAQRRKVEAEFEKNHIEIEPQGLDRKFKPRGPDIVADKDSERWAIECKGTPRSHDWSFGYGLLQTLRNVHEHVRSKGQRGLFGLALPQNEYDRQLRLTPIAFIRRQFDIWVFLYDANRRAVDAIQPEDDIPVATPLR